MAYLSIPNVCIAGIAATVPAPIIQDKLGLSVDCYTLDISLGA